MSFDRLDPEAARRGLRRVVRRHADSLEAAGLTVLDFDGSPLVGDGTTDGTPMFIGDTLIAHVDCTDPPTAIALLESLVVAHVEGRGVGREALQRNRELRLLQRLGRRLASCVTVSSAIREVLDEAVRFFGAAGGAVCWHPADATSVRLGEVPDALPGLLEQVAQTRHADVVSIGTGVVMGAPIGAEGDGRRGALGLYAPDTAWRPSDVQTLTLVVERLEASVVNLDLQDQRLRDSRERERLEAAKNQAERASEAKTSFLANMSHELRTPLNAILGYTELIRDELEVEGLPAATLEDFERVLEAGHHLRALISDVLDLAKIEAGQVSLNPEATTVSPLVRSVVAAVQPLVDATSNTLELEVQDPGHEVMIDAGKIRQILLNLLSNACKFTNAGTIAVVVRLEGVRLYLEVADTGIGMTPEQVDRVFREFVQAEATTQARFGGTGLGLYITRELCLLMGGDISASSVPGEGTTFDVWVPAPPVA